MIEYIKDYGTLKLLLGDRIGMSHAELHIHAGLLVLLAACLILRRPLGSMMPLQIVILLEVANEAVDSARYQMSSWPWTPWNSVADLIDTLLWPVVLTLLARTTVVGGFARRTGTVPDAEPVSDVA